MTFTVTSEELANHNHRAEKMRKRLKEQIAEALLQERLSRKLKLTELRQDVKILPEYIESLELGRKKTNWKYIAILLKYYGKRYQISLVDSPFAKDQNAQ